MKRILVILFTAKANLDPERLAALGIRGVIPKPFEPTELSDHLHRLLDPPPSVSGG